MRWVVDHVHKSATNEMMGVGTSSGSTGQTMVRSMSFWLIKAREEHSYQHEGRSMLQVVWASDGKDETFRDPFGNDVCASDLFCHGIIPVGMDAGWMSSSPS